MNILITGASGFIGSNLMTMLSDLSDTKLFAGTRQTIDLYSLDSVKDFVNKNKINCVIHCAVEGGKRNFIDSSDVVYKNLLMIENLLSAVESNCLFINVGSGAEFDRRESINNKDELEITRKVPIDYYGFSKNLIARRLLSFQKCVTLRLFGCFYHNESSDRFIRSNIERYIRKEPMIIHQDRYMDFIYMEDFAEVIKYYINREPSLKELNWFEINNNITYGNHLKLSEVANIINSLSDTKVDIIIENDIMGKDYIGESYGLNVQKRRLNFKGLEVGIKEVYNKLIGISKR